MRHVIANKMNFLGLLLAIGGLVWSSCAAPKSSVAAKETEVSTDPAPGTTNIYQVTGIVKELKPDGVTAVIKHEAVPNYMPAMTMPFNVHKAEELKGVQVGDKVGFRMLITHDEGWIDEVRVLEAVNQPPPPRPTTRLVRSVDPLNIGDMLPNYPFTNEFNKVIHTDNYRGKAVAITFIFTRCPFPNFCPRMSENFYKTYKALEADPKAPKNWQLFSLSFDTIFDSPAVLKNYAQRYKYDPKKWSFLTGALIEIDDITERFGVRFSREAGTITFNHNLRTVVIDTRGRVHHVFIGNEWTPEQLAAQIKEAAAVPVTGHAPKGK